MCRETKTLNGPGNYRELRETGTTNYQVQIVRTAEGTKSALLIPVLTTISTVCTSTDKTFSCLYQEYRVLGMWTAFVHVLKLNSQSSNGAIQSFLNKIYRPQIDFLF